MPRSKPERPTEADPQRQGDTVLPFDHTKLSTLPEYQRLLRAVSAFTRAEHGLSYDAAVDAVRDVPVLLAFGDPCPRCSTERAPQFALPLAADVDGATATFRYLCRRCGSAWSTGFAAVDQDADSAEAAG